MVIIESSAAEQWIYVKASGFMDDWDDPPDLTPVVREAKSLKFPILYDARNVAMDMGAKKATTNLYMLNQDLGDVRTAVVLSDRVSPPLQFSQRIVKAIRASARFFNSLDEASRWLCDPRRKS